MTAASGTSPNCARACVPISYPLRVGDSVVREVAQLGWAQSGAPWRLAPGLVLLTAAALTVLVIGTGVMGLVLIRFGLVAGIVATFCVTSIGRVPLVPEITMWYGQATVMFALLICGLAVLIFEWYVYNKRVYL